MWLSNVHTWLNPYVSARLARSTTRADGGVVCNTSPISMASLAPKTALAPLSRCGWRRPASGRTLDLTIHARCGRGPKRSLPGSPFARVACSARSGEAEVDGRGVRIRPPGRDHLAAGVEVDALRAVHVGIAEEAGLPAAEAVVAHRHRDRHVDADHADVDVPLELAGGAAVAGEDGGAVAVRVGVDQRHALVVRRHPSDRQDGPEDLVLVRLHVRCHAVQ